MIKCRRKEKPVSCVAECATQNGTIRNIFGGTANRRLSEEDGLVVDLCPDCHNRPPNGVHFNKERMKYLHQYGQMTFEARKRCDGASDEEAREMFMKRYGRNYL